MENTHPSLQAPLLEKNENQSDKQPTYLKTNILDHYLLLWVDKLIKIGKNKPFQQDMHWKLRTSETSNELANNLSVLFEKDKDKKNPLFKALAASSKGLFLKILFLKFLGTFLEFSGPFLIREIINYTKHEEKELWIGISLVIGVILSRILISLLNCRSEILLTLMGIRTSNAINGLVYQKSLRFSLIRSVDHSQGSLVNHIQVDSEKLYYLGGAIGGVLLLPLKLAIGFYFMWVAVGIAFLSGLGALLFIVLLNYPLTSKFFKVQKNLMENKDERMKVTGEVLNGIKYIKMSGWEQAFLEKVLKTKEGELKWLKKDFVLTSYAVFISWLTPMVTTAVIFVTYVLIGNEMNAATAFTLVSTVMILNGSIVWLPYIINMLLESKVALDRVTKYLLAEDIKVDYIKTQENVENETAIKMEKGSFYWLTEEEKKAKKEKEEKEKAEKEKAEDKEDVKKSSKSQKNQESQKESVVVSSQDTRPQLISEGSEPLDMEKGKSSVLEPSNKEYKLILEDININIKKGSFVAILGDVGSGKSSFLFSLVGEMKYDPENPPQIEVNGSISYLTQQPWIQNNTVKDNILFGNEFDEAKYQDVITYSCLQSDLDILPNKDKTEIGEKGVNLSGGQKARVSLARALYRNSDIYLLDDPLSAVDAHVGNYILKECFVKYLGNKTRVLVTHKFESLQFVDYIYIFKKGKIVEQGTLGDLKDSTLFHEIEEKYKIASKVEEPKEFDISKEGELKVEDPHLGEPLGESVLKDTKVVAEAQEEKDNIKKATAEEDKELIEKLMLDEDREIGVVGWNVWKSYFTYYGGWSYFILIFLVMLAFIALQTASNFWLSFWSDHPDHPDYSQKSYLTIYTILSLSYAFFCLIRISMLFMQSIKCSRQLHKDMLTKLIRAPVNLFFDRIPAGRILNRLSKDLTVLDNYIASSFGSLTVMFYCLLADIVVCLIIGTFWIFPLSMIFFIASYKIQRSFMSLNREVTRLESISKSPIVSFFTESLSGLTSIRTYQEQEKFFSQFHKLQNENIKNLILSNGLTNWFHLRVTFCTIIVIAPAVSIPILFSSGPIASGVIALLITYVIQINDDIMYFLWCLSDFESKLVALERCRKFTQIQGEAPAKTSHPEQIANYSSQWPVTGTIEFKNYSVKYRPNLPQVIKNLNVKIQHGEKVGIVGRTGSGKSTMLLSLLRILEPTEGTIYIDGVDITQLGLDDLRNHITIIPQDPILFKGTLRSNLDFLNKYTDEELWQSLEKVCLKEKFQQENGLDTEIKEGGENLSAGEKQLLCIGRAILAKTKIILIDEATSNIDPKTEQTILDTIHNSFKDCTVLTIAHRLKTIINSDKILVMGGGELLEFDSPQSLIENNQTNFHKLWSEHEHGAKNF